MQEVIKLEGVSKRYGDFVALHETSFSIGHGEFFAMLGPSGCGKTTTLKMIAGFEQPTTGRVLLDGADVSDVPAYKRNVNTVFQQYALFPHMSVFDNVAFGPRSKKKDESQVRKDVMEMLEIVRLSDFTQRKPSQLSGGQQQRVALARALVNYPSALLLDEPLAALDLKLREAMQIELKRIQREVEISFIFVTHDQHEALTMSDRIAVMSAGHVEQIGTPEEIYRSPSSLFVAGFIGSANLLAGTVESVSGSEYVVTLKSGTKVKALHQGSRYEVGAKVSLMLRPEALNPVAGTRGDGVSLVGTLTDRVYEGATDRLVVRLADGTELVCLTDSDAKHAHKVVGDAVTVDWQPQAGYLLAGWPEVSGATSTNIDHVEAAL
ncbi:MAG: ABC transporter ATP-binding protein [Ilumatobacteraceae bacterium]